MKKKTVGFVRNVTVGWVYRLEIGGGEKNPKQHNHMIFVCSLTHLYINPNPPPLSELRASKDLGGYGVGGGDGGGGTTI